MAACIDYSTPHNIHISSKNSNSVIQLYRLCRSFKNICKISPQECCNDHIWLKIRQEAESTTFEEPILSDFYHSMILSHTSLERALSNHLAAKLSNAHLSSDALHAVFREAIAGDAEIQRSVRDDVEANKDRDPACLSYLHCFLNYKGFLALQAHRVAHRLWVQGRVQLALLIQSRVSEVFAVDIHPGARVGSGVVIDHATGIVVGETAVVGDNVTILHSVTLGGTGKAAGDRHPKIGDGVVIGAGVKVLGNVRVGENAKIGAGSVVLKEIPAGGTAVGNPARLVGPR